MDSGVGSTAAGAGSSAKTPPTLVGAGVLSTEVLSTGVLSTGVLSTGVLSGVLSTTGALSGVLSTGVLSSTGALLIYPEVLVKVATLPASQAVFPAKPRRRFATSEE